MIAPNPHDVAAARARAVAARGQLLATLSAVQTRLRPANLAQGAVDSATERMTSVARSAVDTARERPVATAAIAGAIGLVLARGWIFDIFKRRGGSGETAAPADGLNNKQKKGQPR
ncbi:hypothetical protein [Sphingomonas sp. M1-B02]|uniref:hypothetical protein n=1 Tax=Sphingomonas sp. M1-B02 TaxID=3114300 RepID=UPI00223FC0FF|nr:hypothetical protein [Sphingomonas sp. S6-11]UZK66825.1 hypothetical protein OKW87_03010 [Sphingomonas sp. S6-11]